MKVKVNRKHFIEVDNIEKIKEVGNICWIYRKRGYPKIYKSDCDVNAFLLRMINVGVSSEMVKIMKDNINRTLNKYNFDKYLKIAKEKLKDRDIVPNLVSSCCEANILYTENSGVYVRPGLYCEKCNKLF